jgi:hypothetical protein
VLPLIGGAQQADLRQSIPLLERPLSRTAVIQVVPAPMAGQSRQQSSNFRWARRAVH